MYIRAKNKKTINHQSINLTSEQEGQSLSWPQNMERNL
jgi:hypothetical protein